MGLNGSSWEMGSAAAVRGNELWFSGGTMRCQQREERGSPSAVNYSLCPALWGYPKLFPERAAARGTGRRAREELADEHHSHLE